ncbi:hypothetical protein B6U81_00110 [Thermoplasmatales archaeon ex4484_30]|nr:MAG: hypothetical protein FE041_00325 [Thermoplasmata archaeon]OYT62744.1 MAG: hypothetical protein B6U81_00110 [Thermoplasmatales archaeon ex4484_30]
MQKLALLMLVLFLLPYANACFVSTDIELQMEETPTVPLGGKTTAEINVTISWGMGLFIPLPLMIHLEVEEIPSWLTISLSPTSFNITPIGFFGGQISKNVELTFYAHKETEAFIPNSFTIYAYTDKNFLMRASEKRKEFYVMQDFYDGGIVAEFPNNVKVIKGESTQVNMNITNNCNSPVVIEIKDENTTNFTLIYSDKFTISSHSEKSVSFRISSDKIGRENARIKITYYPSQKPSARNSIEVPVLLISASKGMAGGSAISVAIIIIIIAIIIYAIWRRK